MLHVDMFSSKICLAMRFTKKTAKHNRTLRLSVNLWLLETCLPMWLQQRNATNPCKTQWGEPLQCTKRLPCGQACQCKLQQVKCRTTKGYAPHAPKPRHQSRRDRAHSRKSTMSKQENLISKISDMQAFCSYVPKQYIAWTQPWQCDLQPGKVNEHLQHTQGARFQRTKITISLVRSTRRILRKVCAGNSQIAILHDPTKRLHRNHATKLRFYF